MRTVAAEEKRWRDTDGLHSPEQKQTGSNGARALSPLHSSRPPASVREKKKPKPEYVHIKKFPFKHWEVTKVKETRDNGF